MEENFEFTTVEQQLDKLTSQHLMIEDRNKAKIALATYGYYSIVNGYRDPFIIREYDKKYYRPNTTFQEIFDLFLFDHRIRDQVFLSMIDLEEHLKTVTAEVIAESFGSDYKEYLKKNNYRDKHVSDPKFRRNNILDSMMNVASKSEKQPVKYYREHHKIVPPWILFKAIYFGTFVNFVRFLKADERNMLIQRLYGVSVTDDNIDFYKDLLSDTLFLCLEYRNLAAHGGRVYNYIPKASVRELPGKIPFAQNGLPQLLYVLECFSYKLPYRNLFNTISKEINIFGQKYVDDIPILSTSIGLEIEQRPLVLINPKSKIYHRSKYCGNCSKLDTLDLDTAVKLGYSPCKRCCPL